MPLLSALKQRRGSRDKATTANTVSSGTAPSTFQSYSSQISSPPAPVSISLSPRSRSASHQPTQARSATAGNDLSTNAVFQYPPQDKNVLRRSSAGSNIVGSQSTSSSNPTPNLQRDQSIPTSIQTGIVNKSSSSETTATQSSLGLLATASASISPFLSSQASSPANSPLDGLSPLTPPSDLLEVPALSDSSVNRPYSPSSPPPTSLHANSVPLRASNSSSGSISGSGIRKAIRDSLVANGFVKSSKSSRHTSGPVSPQNLSLSTGNPAESGSATAFKQGSGFKRPSLAFLKSSQLTSRTTFHQQEQQQQQHHSPRRADHEAAQSNMKRTLSERDFKSKASPSSGQPVTSDLSTLPAEISISYLAHLGLPFLLFDNYESLIYANDSARQCVPAVASLLASGTLASRKDSEQSNAGAAGEYSQADDRRQYLRRRPNHDDPTAAPSHQVKQAPLQSSNVFLFSAYDELGLTSSRLSRDDSGRTFSLAKTLQDFSRIAASYDEASSSTVKNGHRNEDVDSTRKSEIYGEAHHGNASRISMRSTDSGSVFSNVHRTCQVSCGIDGCGANKDRSHGNASCQPLLKLCGQDAQTWWKANISRVTASTSADSSVSSHAHYAVLLIQQMIYKTSDIVPCDDVSSIRSLQEPTARPPLVRAPSNPPIVPEEVSALLDEVNDNTRPVIPMEFYKAAVECMPQILFTSGRDGIVTYLNPQWYAYTGWDMKTPSREMWTDVFHPSDVTIAVDKYSEAIRSGNDIHLQYRVKNKDGQFRWMIARGRCIRDDESNKITGFVCTLTDGQDLIDAQQKAVQTQQYVSTVLKASAITLIVVDKKRKVTMFEGYTEALDKLGVTGEGAMGRLLEDAWPDLECAEQAQAMLAQQDEVETIPEREFATTVGPSHFRYRLTPLYESKSADIAKGNSNTAACLRQFSGLAVVCTDISAMVHAELALVQSQKEREALAASEEAAREASRLKTVFVTSLSHEIRTPISGMLGISELLLRDDSLSDKHRSLVQKQLHAGELLLQLVSMVLDIGKMEANKLELEHEPFFISELMSDLDIFASLADAKGIYFERIVDVMQDCAFEGDRLRLAQVLSNFISNAVKFTSQGGITLRVEQEEKDNHSELLFQLEDTGTGIDKESLPQLFKPFHQGNVSIARRFGGSGLGLSIAKSLTELMGGTVSLDSLIGVGTSVQMRIPLRKANKLSQLHSKVRTGFGAEVLDDSKKLASTLPGVADLSHRRGDVSILIAEDNSLLQEIYLSLVKKMGFGKVRVVEDGLQAIEAVEQSLPHLILMDIEMPRMNGPDAVRHIRSHANKAVRDVKIIALTANAVSGDEQRFLNIGMDKYLSKPVRATKLEEAILNCLSGL